LKRKLGPGWGVEPGDIGREERIGRRDGSERQMSFRWKRFLAMEKKRRRRRRKATGGAAEQVFFWCGTQGKGGDVIVG